jgi:phosphate starvation-inducible PhoH-like protein
MKFQPLFKSLAMFVLVHNIRPVFSFMGRNRKSLGGQWGESVMTTMMAEYNTGKHMKGNKKMKKPSTYHSSSDSDFYVTKPGHSQSHTPTKKRNEPLYKPKTVNQELYLRFLNDDSVKIVLGVGPAGCGKTLFACHRAIEELRSGNIEKIVVTRPMVAVEDESVGFLPGDMNQKMAPWTRPIFDIFGEYYDVDDLNEMVRKGVIEISPLAYMRGRTFKNSFIIADEMQNSTPNQMMMVTTRLGQDSKMVITGDLKQSDKSTLSGLSDFIEVKFPSTYGAAKYYTSPFAPDTNGDGMIDDGEKAAAQAKRAQRKASGAGGGASGDKGKHGSQDPAAKAARKQKMMARFDTNGDGQLDSNEKAALEAFRQQRRQQRMQRQGGGGAPQ